MLSDCLLLYQHGWTIDFMDEGISDIIEPARTMVSENSDLTILRDGYLQKGVFAVLTNQGHHKLASAGRSPTRRTR